MSTHPSSTAEPLLELKGVSKRFAKRVDFADRLVSRLLRNGAPPTVHAVDGVDLSIRRGEVVGLVGESGCGKSTLGRIAAGVHRPSEGELRWRGVPLSAMNRKERFQANLQVQMIFQDPMSSLNPRKRVREIIGEAPLAHGLVARDGVDALVDGLMRRVGLDPAYKLRYPHQFSGGQRARIGIARALAVQPRMLVCDESVAALDVSVQAQVINLFMELRRELDLTCLFISHDLGVVEHISDRVVIMYLGRVVETAPTEALFARPRHPYAQALLAEVPKIVTEPREYIPIRGEIPSPLNPPSGCHFHPRCPHAKPLCAASQPALREVAPLRRVACHFAETIDASGARVMREKAVPA